MSKVKITNVTKKETPTLEIKTLDRAKGNVYEPLGPGKSITIDEKQLSDQIRVLGRDKKTRAALLQLEVILSDDIDLTEPEEFKQPDEEPPIADDYSAEEDDQDEDTTF